MSLSQEQLSRARKYEHRAGSVLPVHLSIVVLRADSLRLPTESISVADLVVGRILL